MKTEEPRKRSVDESNNFFKFLTSVINSMGTWHILGMLNGNKNVFSGSWISVFKKFVKFAPSYTLLQVSWDTLGDCSRMTWIKLW